MPMPIPSCYPHTAPLSLYFGILHDAGITPVCSEWAPVPAPFPRSFPVAWQNGGSAVVRVVQFRGPCPYLFVVRCLSFFP